LHLPVCRRMPLHTSSMISYFGDKACHYWCWKNMCSTPMGCEIETNCHPSLRIMTSRNGNEQ
jgi:hypothetical protein